MPETEGRPMSFFGSRRWPLDLLAVERDRLRVSNDWSERDLDIGIGLAATAVAGMPGRLCTAAIVLFGW